MSKTVFSPADVLLPQNAALPLWSVVACDQYTSEPEYWARVAKTVGETPSALRMILPEADLEKPGLPERIAAVNTAMKRYLSDGIFREYKDQYIYIERTLSAGKRRHGLIGKVDLEEYDYSPDAQPLIRPTEGTVESRLPPRVRVREHAPLETPHIMMLIDDPAKTVIEPLAGKIDAMEPLYDFTLMENGGKIKGYAVPETIRTEIDAALAVLMKRAGEGLPAGKKPLLIAAGDGNHSLATAKACFDRLKQTLPAGEWQTHPARYALVELVNVHDPALEFEPIHRVLFGVSPDAVMSALRRFYRTGISSAVGTQSFEIVHQGKRDRLYIADPPTQLAAGTLQRFIDDYLSAHPGTVDYIHGAEVAARLAESADAIGFLLPVLEKRQLFQTVLLDGALPRKSFSMGHAQEKRFYLESRKIKPD